jgi:hypothetical protein
MVPDNDSEIFFRMLIFNIDPEQKIDNLRKKLLNLTDRKSSLRFTRAV